MGKLNATSAARAAARRSSDIEDIERFARLLDARYRLPGTQIRFGLDALLGVVPGLGDAAALIPACYLLFRAYQLGARKRTLARMAVNTGLDTALGAVPIAGDVFDLFFKSNRRNAALLRRELDRHGPAARAGAGGRAL